MKSKIKITTTQYDQDNNKEVLDFSFDGDFIKKNNKIHLGYKEENITNKITVDLDKKEVISKKLGMINSEMIFSKDNKHSLKYKTHLGIFDMIVSTNNLDIEVFEEELKMKIDYNLEVKNLFKGKNILDITVEKV
ncbi:MAG: DUF1934 domain-containing protein [Peptostreptococcaceae bacterium]